MLDPWWVGTLMANLVLMAVRGESMGVNWGTSSSHRLPLEVVVALLKSNNITRVKLSDSDPLILQALSGSGIRVSIGVPNSMLRLFNSSSQAARSWVHDNVTRYFSADGTTTLPIDYVTVGEEPFLLKYGQRYQHLVLGAATNIRMALSEAKPGSEAKVVVPCGLDTLRPGNGSSAKPRFRDDLNTTMSQLLAFLRHTGSPFFVNILPFAALPSAGANPPQDSAVFGRDMFESAHADLVSALSEAGFPGMETVVAQTGWPTDGGAGATPSAAEAFMKWVAERAGRRGRRPSETYVLSLLDEDERGEGYERHWGVFTFDGQAKYRLDFGRGGGGGGLVNARGVGYLPSRWCVAERDGDLSNAAGILTAVCSSADCSALSPGASCSDLSAPARLSYAFNAFYQLHDQNASSCGRQGLGRLTTVDPSVEGCRFLVQLQTSSSAFVMGFFCQRCCLVFLACSLLFFGLPTRLEGWIG